MACRKSPRHDAKWTFKTTTQGSIDWPASIRNAGRNEIGTGGRLRFGINGRLQRNTQSSAKLMRLALPVPDFSTLSRRGKSLKVAQKSRASDKPITLIVDSTGLKVHSEVGWNGHKHGAKGARKSW
ncbi:transposase [Allorhizobium sp. NPDC080224]|uniref:transposase n=1 Tax=Allorhizobium sp. NPDC080224 TaxID=3390547 RepID=UPI003D03418D